MKKRQLMDERVEMHQRITESETSASETGRKQMEHRLRILSSILEQTTEGIAYSNLEGYLSFVNNAYAGMHGYSPEELVGKHFSIFHTANQMPSVEAANREIQETGKFTGEIWHVRRDGTPFPTMTRNSLLRDEMGNPVGVIAALHDITERKQAEGVLRKRTHDLGKRVKELNCLYGISHLVERPDTSLEEILQGILDLIPPAWQYPEITCARITVQGQIFRTNNFKETIWKQSCDIIVRGDRVGILEVCYLEEKPEIYEGPFLKEERSLINAVAERIGRVTERKLAEEALRESEARFRDLFEKSPIGIEIYDSEGQLLNANKAYLDIFGISHISQVGGFNLFEDPNVTDKVKQRLRTGETVRYEVPLDFEKVKELNLYETTKSGIIYLDVLISPLGLKEDKFVIGYLVQVQDISDRKRAEEHIHALTHELLRSQENERQMISRELHDRVAQDLSTLKICFETLFDNQPAVSPEVIKKVSKFSKTLQETIMAVRDLSYSLRPPALDYMGLVQAVFHYSQEFSDNSGIKVDFQSAGMKNLKLNFDMEINLYRLIQEGLTNIRKHADASHVTIRLTAAYPNIILRIEDDGKGFDVEERLATITDEKRMGLRSMAERVKLLGGEMEIQSRLMQGTKISIKFPYTEK